jgi:hypothetical protein
MTFLFSAGINTSELEQLSATYCNSMYSVMETVMKRKGIVFKREIVEKDGVSYDFCYIPIEQTLRQILSDHTAMEHLYEWHQSSRFL